MNPQNAEKIIQTGLEKGADFVELFEEETTVSNLSIKDSKIDETSHYIRYGIGIRLIFGTEVFYTCANNNNLEVLLSLIENDLISSKFQSVNHKSFQFVSQYSPSIHPILIEPQKKKPQEKLDFIYISDKEARKISALIKQVSVSIYDSISYVNIFNSEGLFTQDRRILSRYSISVTAEQDGKIYITTESPGAKKGFEFIQNLDVQDIARRTAERSLRMLQANHIQGGNMPVVIGNGFGGVIFHEACGHPLETEAIRKKSSPFCNKVEKMIAHPSLTAYDDGTIQNMWGSLDIDDEGYPTEKTLLIQNGILKNYLADRIGSKELGIKRTGSARRESYQYSPVSRMRNTYIDKGKDQIEDMIYSIDYGLYAPKMGGGSVNPSTGEFNFSVEEGYVIRKGKIVENVQGANLIGKGQDILPLISMIADDLEFAAGICGASSGAVPVTVGQPTLKVDQILVGGR